MTDQVSTGVSIASIAPAASGRSKVTTSSGRSTPAVCHTTKRERCSGSPGTKVQAAPGGASVEVAVDAAGDIQAILGDVAATLGTRRRGSGPALRSAGEVDQRGDPFGLLHDPHGQAPVGDRGDENPLGIPVAGVDPVAVGLERLDRDAGVDR